MKANSRFQPDNIADAVAFVADGRADLAHGVHELNTQHPLGRGQLDLTGKLMDVLDQSAQQETSAFRHLGAHGVDDIGSEVGVELAVGRHCDEYTQLNMNVNVNIIQLNVLKKSKNNDEECTFISSTPDCPPECHSAVLKNGEPNLNRHQNRHCQLRRGSAVVMASMVPFLVVYCTIPSHIRALAVVPCDSPEFNPARPT